MSNEMTNPAEWHATQHHAGLVEIQWVCGPVGVQADGRVGFVVESPFRVFGTGRKARVCTARREIRSFDERGTMFVTVLG